MSRITRPSLPLWLLVALTVFSAAQALPSAFPQHEPNSATQNGPVQSLLDQGNTALREGRRADAEKLFLLALAEAEKIGDDCPQLSTALVLLANLHSQKGDYPQAIILLERAVAVDENPRHPQPSLVLRDLSNLAQVYQLQNKTADAEKYYAKALEIEANTQGMDSLSRIHLLSNASSFYRAQKKYAEAETLLKRALEIPPGSDESTGAAAKFALIQLRRSLGLLYREEGKEEEAEKLLAEPAATDPVADAKNNIFDLSGPLDDRTRANQYKAQGKFREAEELYIRAITTLEKGPKLRTASLLSEALGLLAEVYHAEGRNSEAEQAFLRAFDVWEVAARVKRTQVARYCLLTLRLVPFYRDQGQLSEVEPYLTRALRVQETILGPADAAVGTTLAQLADLYAEERKFDDAISTYTRVLEIQEANFGPDDRHVASTLDKYAVVLQEVGRTEDAATMRARAKEIHIKFAAPPPSN